MRSGADLCAWLPRLLRFFLLPRGVYGIILPVFFLPAGKGDK